MPYEAGLDLMRRRAAERRAGTIPNTLLLLEHPPTITLGLRADTAKELRAPTDEIAGAGIAIIATDRGGLATLHAPGQVVGYLICALDGGLRALPGFVGSVERWLADALSDWGVEAAPHARDIGLWLADSGETANAADKQAAPRRKIASIGLALHEGVTTHGFAVNVANDLSLFAHLRPCGLDDAVAARLADVADRARCPRGTPPSPAAFMQSLLERLPPQRGLPSALSGVVAAFNRRTAAEAAACFTADGVFATPRDGRIEGRPAIEEHFRAFFERAELAHLSLDAVHGDRVAERGCPAEFAFAYRFAWSTPGTSAPRVASGIALVAVADGDIIRSWKEYWPGDWGKPA